MARPLALPCDQLCTFYLGGHSTTVLARRFDCSPTTIANALRRCGVTLRRARFHAAVVPEAALRQHYLEQRLPIAEIAAYFGVSPSTISNKRRMYGIQPRGRR